LTKIPSRVSSLFLSNTWSPEVPEPGLVDNDDVLQVDEEELALLVHSEVAGGPVYNSRKLVQTLTVSRFFAIKRAEKQTNSIDFAFLKDIKCILAAHSVLMGRGGGWIRKENTPAHKNKKQIFLCKNCLVHLPMQHVLMGTH
jgi:hypothetical protein